jgi:DNA-binding winged helix-turn-helix (wHTH) protein
VKYTFGSVSVDTDARSSSRREGPIHLTRKAFDLLLLLLECRPNAVSKEQIYARLWPDTYVAESSLQTLIHEIRQAIDDRESERSWVRTVHGIGYSFAGPVALSEGAAPSSVSARAAAWLVGESTRVALRSGENIVGRGVEDEDDVIAIDAPTVSRRHARITIAETVTLEDLGSKNGTWLKGQRLTTPRVLVDGEVVRLGSATFTFRLNPQTPSTETADLSAADLDRAAG